MQIIDFLEVEPALPLEWQERLDQVRALEARWLDDETPAPSRATADLAESLLWMALDEDLP